jgi:hypothetical protein
MLVCYLVWLIGDEDIYWICLYLLSLLGIEVCEFWQGGYGESGRFGWHGGERHIGYRGLSGMS